GGRRGGRGGGGGGLGRGNGGAAARGGGPARRHASRRARPVRMVFTGGRRRAIHQRHRGEFLQRRVSSHDMGWQQEVRHGERRLLAGRTVEHGGAGETGWPGAVSSGASGGARPCPGGGGGRRGRATGASWRETAQVRRGSDTSTRPWSGCGRRRAPQPPRCPRALPGW